MLRVKTESGYEVNIMIVERRKKDGKGKEIS